MKHIIVDLDGTLANVDHRLNLVRRKKKWFDKFYELAWKDKPNEWCFELVKAMMALGHEVHIVSARPKSLEDKTINWLLKNGLDGSSERLHLWLLRKEKDFRPDTILKRDWLHGTTSPLKKDILFVVDDRKRVVEMWRAEGLVCLQCYEWEEFVR